MEVKLPRTRQREGSIFVSILGYREGGEWVALALEMDLRGFGKSFEEAFDELIGLIEAQVSFAYFKKEPGLIWHAAEPEYFELFDRARKEYVAKQFTGKIMEDEYRAQVEYFPDPQVIAQKVTAYQNRERRGLSPAARKLLRRTTDRW